MDLWPHSSTGGFCNLVEWPVSASPQLTWEPLGHLFGVIGFICIAKDDDDDDDDGDGNDDYDVFVDDNDDDVGAEAAVTHISAT